MNTTETVKLNLFETKELSDDVKLQGYIFSANTILVLREEATQIANQLLTLKFDSAKLVDAAIEQAYLQGQLEYVITLLNRHSETEKFLNTLPT